MLIPLILGVALASTLFTSKQVWVTLDSPVVVNFQPNTREEYSSYHLNDLQVKRTALLFTTYFFKVPSNGTYRFTLNNANVQGSHDVNLFVYYNIYIPTVTSDWSANLAGSSIQSFNQSYERVDVTIEEGWDMAIIVYPYYVYKRPTNLTLTVTKL